MTPLLEGAIANAVLAVPLAALAVVSVWLRRPAVTHAVWMLVLLRLLMPPIWRVPLPEWPGEYAPPAQHVALQSSNANVNSAVVDESTCPELATTLEIAQASSPPPSELRDVGFNTGLSWQALIVAAWLAGTAGCLGLAVTRAIAFHRLLRHAEPAPITWQQMCGRLSRRLGLRCAPRVLLVHGPVSPMLWVGFGRPRVLLPADLAARLDGRRRAALLTHELAHLRRGDHRVRWLELATTAVYWWHPVAWVARRGLREAEEQCCDAWVVWLLPAARRAYADALIDAVDFLSSTFPALPPLASGLGMVHHLKRRVVMIMRGQTARRLSGPGLLASLALGTVLLAITPGRGQDSPRVGPDEEPRPDPRPRSAARDEDPRRAAEADERRAEASKLRQQIRQLHEKLMEAERRLADIEGRPAPQPGFPAENMRPGSRVGRNAPGGLPPGTPAADGPDVPRTGPRPPAPPSAPVAPSLPRGSVTEDRRLRDLEKELAELRRDIADMRREMRRPETRVAPVPRPPEP
jgi:beta-lactamase regulating signal transducer with metallopeptidase domain